MDKITNIVDAIRIGSLKHPQCRYKLVDWDGLGIKFNVTHTCALGAAAIAVGWDFQGTTPNDLWISERFEVPDDLLTFVTDCNDTRCLSRETIAAILAAREWKQYNNQEALWTR